MSFIHSSQNGESCPDIKKNRIKKKDLKLKYVNNTLKNT